MRFLRTRYSLNYKADFQNHVSYLPPIEVLKRKFSSSDEKGKANAIIDEAFVHWMVSFAKLHLTPPMMTLPLMTLPPYASTQNPQGTAPRVMTDRELLLSLHQKADRNHKWVKRQFGSILHNMTTTHNAPLLPS